MSNGHGPQTDIPFPRSPEPPRPSLRRPAMQVAGLFAGVGGLELGLSRSGHEARLLCEIDEGAAAVLRHQFPQTDLHDDVATLRELPSGTELLVGGFPCQDLSQAGKTKGIKGAKSGLVGEVFRLIEAQPVPWLLLENVPFMLQLAKGEALEVIVAKLEQLGYRWAYRVVNSQAFGLPQRRRRVYIVASLEDDPRDVLFADDEGAPEKPDMATWKERACGFYWTEGLRGLGWADDGVPTLKGGSTVGVPSPPAIVLPPTLAGDGPRVVKPDIRDAERLQGFEPNWTAPAEKVVRTGFRWKLVGNAVSVQVAEWIGRRLRQPGSYDGSGDRPMNRKRSWPTAGWNLGSGRFVADVSEFPIREERPALAEFLDHPGTPLSVRATRGFQSRMAKAKLRFPPGFPEVIEEHLRWAEQNEPRKPTGRVRKTKRPVVGCEGSGSATQSLN